MTNLGRRLLLSETRLEAYQLLKTYRKEPTASRPSNVHDGITSAKSPRLFFQRCLLDITINQIKSSFVQNNDF